MSSYDCVLPVPDAAIGEVARGRTGGVGAFQRRAVPLEAALPMPVHDFYGHLQARPEVAVAGGKNGFRLAGLRRTWLCEQSVYACTWEAPRPDAELLDLLLHGLRVLPGEAPLAISPGWPAHDDPRVCGWLFSAEVRELDALAGAWTESPHTRQLRALVAAAASARLALVALQGGL